MALLKFSQRTCIHRFTKQNKQIIATDEILHKILCFKIKRILKRYLHARNDHSIPSIQLQANCALLLASALSLPESGSSFQRPTIIIKVNANEMKAPIRPYISNSIGCKRVQCAIQLPRWKNKQEYKKSICERIHIVMTNIRMRENQFFLNTCTPQDPYENPLPSSPLPTVSAQRSNQNLAHNFPLQFYSDSMREMMRFSLWKNNWQPFFLSLPFSNPNVFEVASMEK